jgi:hypothetical protein
MIYVFFMCCFYTSFLRNQLLSGSNKVELVVVSRYRACEGLQSLPGGQGPRGEAVSAHDPQRPTTAQLFLQQCGMSQHRLSQQGLFYLYIWKVCELAWYNITCIITKAQLSK